MDSRSLRIALLSYRSLPTSGGQGVYIRHLSRELIGLGHQVHVFSGPPYPELVDGVELTELPSLELWREPDPFRIPRPSEFKSRVDVVEFAHTATGAFSEPLSGTLRMWRALHPGKGAAAQRPPFDIVHDNQSLGYGLLGLRRSLAPYGIPVVATIHHPITVDRRLSSLPPKASARISGCAASTRSCRCRPASPAAWTACSPSRRSPSATSRKNSAYQAK